jgi:WD40 repeat protein/mono/diheme cytochrome c family protein
MTWVRPLVLASAVTALAGALPAAAEPEVKIPGEISYYRDVRKVFQQHCQGCHQPAKPMGGYVMTDFAKLVKTGDHGQAPIVPAQPEKSYLIEQITLNADTKKAEMPKGRDALPPKDVELITKWIAQGAKDDTPEVDRDPIDAAHPPVYELPPVIPSLEFSPDGSLLAVAGFHEVLLHKADGSGLVGRLVGVSERVQTVAFSPDGETLAAAGGSPGRFGELQFWDFKKKKLKASFPMTFDTLYGLSWSHDGTRVAFGCADNTVRAVDVTTGKQVLYQGSHTDWPMGTVWSKDDKFLATVSRDRSTRLTEVETQRVIDNITSITPGALKGGLLAIDRNPVKRDAKVKVDAAGIDKSDKFYEEVLIGWADGIPRLYKMHRETKRVIGDDANKVRDYPALPGRIYALKFNPEGNLFAAGSSLDGEGEVRVFQTGDGKQVAKMEGKPGAVYALAWTPDGKTLAVAGFDGMVRLCDPATGKVTKEFSAVPLAQPKAP